MRISDWSSDVCSSDLPNGEQIGWMTSMTDITEPKRIREALTAAHERFMTVLEGLDDAISVVADTSDGLELLFANRTYRRFFGAQSGGHAELLGGRLGRFTDETIETFSESSQRWFEVRSEEHTSELQSLMSNSYAVL